MSFSPDKNFKEDKDPEIEFGFGFVFGKILKDFSKMSQEIMIFNMLEAQKSIIDDALEKLDNAEKKVSIEKVLSSISEILPSLAERTALTDSPHLARCFTELKKYQEEYQTILKSL